MSWFDFSFPKAAEAINPKMTGWRSNELIGYEALLITKHHLQKGVSIFFYFYWLSFYRSVKFHYRKNRVVCGGLINNSAHRKIFDFFFFWRTPAKLRSNLICQLIKETRLNILHEALHKVVLQSVEAVFQIFIKSFVNIFLLEKKENVRTAHIWLLSKTFLFFFCNISFQFNEYYPRNNISLSITRVWPGSCSDSYSTGKVSCFTFLYG